MASRASFPVVGVGASAGGVEALEGLFRPMPPKAGMAFVVVTHLGPNQESVLGEIIGRTTKMPVVGIKDNQTVEPDHIYVLTRDAVITMDGGKLRLRTPIVERRARNPIDVFFGTLATDVGDHAVGIILSGSGSDGALGIKAIKERGGLAVAQGSDHTVPRHSGMPQSAIATGVVDLVLPVQDIAGKLIEYAQGFARLQKIADIPPTEPERARADQARRAIHETLRQQIGHDFSGYKDKTFFRRVERRMQVLQLQDVQSYVEHLRKNPGEATLLFRDLLISVTSFFRDAEAWEVLERTVIPRLFEGKGASDAVRIWIAGCATGEEVYSLAILCREYMETLSGRPKLMLFATDIDENALQVARTGRYPMTMLANVSPERLSRFFRGDGSSYVVAKELRELCVFSVHSIIRDPPFSRIDLVSCRNLLIYLTGELQADIIPVFHYALRPGGFLFLGVSEGISRHSELFTAVDRQHRIFRREQPAKQQRLPAIVQRTHGRPGPPETPLVRTAPVPATLRQRIEARVLERHSPSYVAVDAKGEIVFYSARTGKYLEAASGSPTRQLATLARRELRLPLRDALNEAFETRLPAIRRTIETMIDDHIQRVELRVDPLAEQEGEPLYLVLFDDIGPPIVHDVPQAGAPRSQEEAAIAHLERELRDTRERLQAVVEEHETTIEELRSANEELLSVNEEAQSANEELETSKEEMQSVNEELQTVNTELNTKIEALDRLNSDLRNLFESTEIATVFLDGNLAIRSYTPAMTRIFNLLPADRGRPLTDITARLDSTGLHNDLKMVLSARTPLERRVTQDDGKTHFLVRILPYRNAENEVDGVVMTLIDITGVVAAEEQAALLAELNHRVRNMLAVVIGFATQSIAHKPSLQAFGESYLGRLHALAAAHGLLSRVSWGDVTLRDVVERQMKPYVDDQARVTVGGPVVLLRAKAGVALAMVFHELATNAMKHGALSVPGGGVDLTWAVTGAPDDIPTLNIHWRERGGPPAVAPNRKGFGSELIARTTSYELGGQARLDYTADGLDALLEIPLTPELGSPGAVAT